MHIFVGPVLISDQPYLEQILLLPRNTRGCIAAVSGKRQEVISEQKNIGANKISEQKYIKAKEDIIAKKSEQKISEEKNMGTNKISDPKKISEQKNIGALPSTSEYKKSCCFFGENIQFSFFFTNYNQLLS